jgi:hypothetical protein
MKRGTQRVLNPEAMSFLDQDQKVGLEGVVRIAKQSVASPKDHRPVPLNQSRECELRLLPIPARKAFQELPVRQIAGRPELENSRELPGSSSARPNRHLTKPRPPGWLMKS